MSFSKLCRIIFLQYAVFTTLLVCACGTPSQTSVPVEKPAGEQSTANLTTAVKPDESTVVQSDTAVHGFVFASYKDNWDIIFMKEDGTGRTNLTVSSVRNNLEPTWSPDTSKIAFISDRDGGNEIYVMNVDGTNVKRLTNTKGGNHSPVWAPDSRKIAYVSFDRWSEYNYTTPGFLTKDICVMDADGKNQQNITGGLSEFKDTASICPVWSPDGKKIAFMNMQVGLKYTSSDGRSTVYFTNRYPQIYTYNFSDGSVVKIDSSNMDTNISPCWSADSSSIFFLSNREGSMKLTDYWHIFCASVDGGSVKRLNDSYYFGWGGISQNYPINATDFAWLAMSPNPMFAKDWTTIWSNNLISLSPDGKLLATRWQVMDLSGKNIIKISGLVTPQNSSWAPDGSRIAYVPRSSSVNPTSVASNLVIANSDGSDPQTIFDCYVGSALTWR